MRALRFVFSRFFICVFFIAALTAAIIFLCFYIHSLLPAAAAIALAYTLSLAATLSLLAGGTASDFKYSWLTLIIILPVGGATLYFLSRFSRCEKRERAHPYPPSSYERYEYFAEGSEYLERLTELLATAERYIYLEYYIIAEGEIWQRICGELIKALGRGVRVKVVYDWLGSALRAPKKDFKRLAKAGAEIAAFNKLLPLPVTRLNFRDHRKIAIIDGKAVFVGGVNLADEYANLSSPHGHWKDGGALFYGQIAADYAKKFFPSAQASAGKRRIKRGEKITPVADEPLERGSACEDLLAAGIFSAHKRIYVFSPYLCMGDKLCDALSFAAQRGLDVKIIIPGIPDKKLTYAITKAYAAKLTARGVGVYVYTPGFLHFKAVICDDELLIGSYNLDFRSMRLNYECGVLTTGEPAGRAAADFLGTLALCEKYCPAPPTPAVRLLRSLLSLFAPLV